MRTGKTRDKLSRTERWQLALVRKGFDDPTLNRLFTSLQRSIGSGWISMATRSRTRIVGLERLPTFEPDRGYLCVANHRSFFDLYVVFAILKARGLPHRVVCPVRSRFFYDAPLGLVLNGAMSFFSMYPPVFRERERQVLNLEMMDEVVRLLRRGGAFVGMHPEGTRSKSDDPYSLLPAQSGVGRIVRRAAVPVIPCFIRGLTNAFLREASGRGGQVSVVFGSPIVFGNLLEEPESPRLFRSVTSRVMEAISHLGDEERNLPERPA